MKFKEYFEEYLKELSNLMKDLVDILTESDLTKEQWEELMKLMIKNKK